MYLRSLLLKDVRDDHMALAKKRARNHRAHHDHFEKNGPGEAMAPIVELDFEKLGITSPDKVKKRGPVTIRYPKATSEEASLTIDEETKDQVVQRLEGDLASTSEDENASFDESQANNEEDEDPVESPEEKVETHEEIVQRVLERSNKMMEHKREVQAAVEAKQAEHDKMLADEEERLRQEREVERKARFARYDMEYFALQEAREHIKATREKDLSEQLSFHDLTLMHKIREEAENIKRLDARIHSTMLSREQRKHELFVKHNTIETTIEQTNRKIKSVQQEAVTAFYRNEMMHNHLTKESMHATSEEKKAAAVLEVFYLHFKRKKRIGAKLKLMEEQQSRQHSRQQSRKTSRKNSTAYSSGFNTPGTVSSAHGSTEVSDEESDPEEKVTKCNVCLTRAGELFCVKCNMMYCMDVCDPEMHRDGIFQNHVRIHTDHALNPDEVHAKVTKIQAMYRGCYTRRTLPLHKLREERDERVKKEEEDIMESLMAEYGDPSIGYKRRIAKKRKKKKRPARAGSIMVSGAGKVKDVNPFPNATANKSLDMLKMLHTQAYDEQAKRDSLEEAKQQKRDNELQKAVEERKKKTDALKVKKAEKARLAEEALLKLKEQKAALLAKRKKREEEEAQQKREQDEAEQKAQAEAAQVRNAELQRAAASKLMPEDTEEDDYDDDFESRNSGGPRKPSYSVSKKSDSGYDDSFEQVPEEELRAATPMKLAIAALPDKPVEKKRAAIVDLRTNPADLTKMMQQALAENSDSESYDDDFE